MKTVSLKIVLYLLASVILLVMMRLGFWQLSRADEKQKIQDRVTAQQSKIVDLGENAIDQNFIYQQGQGTGEFLIEQSFLVDNQVHAGKVGYHALAPFRFSPNQQIVLVNLGWLAVGESRDKPPEIKLSEGQLVISGRLQNPHGKPPIWSDDALLVQQGVWQFLPIDEFEQQAGLNVAPLILELSEDASNFDLYERQWREYDDTWINRHKAYALQWFSMAVAFFLMCLVVEFRSRKKLD